jgi:DNA-binding NtrC family response regulator
LLKLEGHGIRVRSVLAKGTCFIVTLPAVAEVTTDWKSLGPSGRTTDVDGSCAVKGAYILLVEDDPEARLALHALFAEWGVLWSSGSSITEALDAHGQTERRVDAIIADYRLAGASNGIDCIRSARRSLGYCPNAVLMTAEVEVELLASHLPEKCFLLKKPFDPSVLCGLLYAALTAALEEERKSCSATGDPILPSSSPGLEGDGHLT